MGELRHLPILTYHGEHDRFVSPRLLQEMFEPLAELGFHWEFHNDCDLGHEFMGEERVAVAIGNFLRKHRCGICRSRVAEFEAFPGWTDPKRPPRVREWPTACEACGEMIEVSDAQACGAQGSSKRKYCTWCHDEAVLQDKVKALRKEANDLHAQICALSAESMKRFDKQ